jgi:hypothetical protein
MVPVAVAIIAGLVAGRFVPLGEAAWAAWGGGSLAAAVVCLAGRWRWAAAGAVAAAIVALGALHARIAYYRLPADHVATYVGPSRMPATIRGRIAGAPSIYAADESAGYPHQPTTGFELEASEIRVGPGWQPVSGLVQVSVLQADRRLHRGQQVVERDGGEAGGVVAHAVRDDEFPTVQ